MKLFKNILITTAVAIILTSCNNDQDNEKLSQESEGTNQVNEVISDAKIEVIIDQDFEQKDLINPAIDMGLFEIVDVDNNHLMYPTPSGQNVLNYQNSSPFTLKFELGELKPDSIYSTSFYAASSSEESLSNLTVFFKKDGTDKVYKGVMSAQDASFKVNSILWNRVFLSIDTSEIEGLEEGDSFYLEINGKSILMDDLLVTRRSKEKNDFYISSSEGVEGNIGSIDAPYSSMKTLNGTQLMPGDHVYIKSGDTFNEKVYLTGKGEETDKIVITSYDEGPRPIFYLNKNKLKDVIFTYENASYVSISNLNMKEGKIGLYLRYYQDYGNKDVTVENCLFENMDDMYCAPQEFQNELGFSSGIWLSGHNPGGKSDVLDGLTLLDNGFEYCVSGFNTNWFYFDPAGHTKDILKNLVVQGGYAKASSVAGSLLVQWTDGAIIKDFRQFGRDPKAETEWFMWGSTGLMIGSSKNILIEGCELSDVNRYADNEELLQEYVKNPDKIIEMAGGFEPYFGLHYAFSGDACGIDIDGNNENVIFRNNVVHNNDGMGLELLTTISPNQNVTIENCTFYNNGTNVKNKYAVENFYWDGTEWVIEYNKKRYLFHGDAWEVKLDNQATGTLDQVNMYRAENSFGWISSNGNRIKEGEYNEYWYRDIKDLPDEKTFNVTGAATEDLEEMVAFESIFINGFRTPTLEINMKVESGKKMKVYYITDLDRTYSEDKVLEVGIDNQQDTYQIDLQENGFLGVIVGIRLQASDDLGAEYQLSSIKFK